MASSSKSPAPFVRRITRQTRSQSEAELEHQDDDDDEREPIEAGPGQDESESESEMKREIRQLKERLDELTKVSEQHSRSVSPAFTNISNASNASYDISTSEVTKELIRLIPRYDGNGGIQKLLEFVDNFEVFAASTKPTPETELTLATAKLTGDAKMWWREHRKMTEMNSSERIRTWDELQQGLKDTFIPIENDEEL